MSSPLFLHTNFYNDDHERALQGLSIYPLIRDCVSADGIDLHYEEFLAYAIFREQTEDDGYVTFQDLQMQLGKYVVPYEEYYTYIPNTIFLKRKHGKTPGKPMTEMGGVGAALSIASKLYGLSEADWQRIPETREKTLDFRIAANNSIVIEVEAKAHAVEDTGLRGSLAKDANHIEGKKDDRLKSSGKIPFTEFIAYVTHFPPDQSQHPRTWIFDPEPISLDIEPRKLRILKRVYFYWKLIAGISRAAIVPALINRFYSLAKSRNYNDFDGLPLMGATGEPMQVSPSFTTAKTYIESLDACGEVIQLPNGSFFFYGFKRRLLHLLLRQRFSELLEFKAEAARDSDVRFTALMRTRNFKREQSLIRESEVAEVPSFGDLFTTSSGRIFGWAQLDLESVSRRRVARAEEEPRA